MRYSAVAEVTLGQPLTRRCQRSRDSALVCIREGHHPHHHHKRCDGTRKGTTSACAVVWSAMPTRSRDDTNTTATDIAACMTRIDDQMPLALPAGRFSPPVRQGRAAGQPTQRPPMATGNRDKASSIPTAWALVGGINGYYILPDADSCAGICTTACRRLAVIAGLPSQQNAKRGLEGRLIW